MTDLSSAFDTIDHSIMLRRFEHSFGITGQALKWLQSYIQNRTQSVAIGTARSSPSKLAYGVPQGSVLGPMLYCMYTRPVGDIARHHDLSHHSYADDGQGYDVITAPSLWPETSSKISDFVCELQDWMSRNMLKLNNNKFEFIIFHPKHRHIVAEDFRLCIGENSYTPSRCVSNLGVNQDEALTMEKHVSRVSRSCYHQLRSISKIRQYITVDACRSLIQATVTSRLDYGNVLLHNLPKKSLKRLQMVQNASARLITRTSRRTHITPVLIGLHWLPIQYRTAYKVLLYVYKAVHGEAPAYICNLVEEYVPTRSLRSASQHLLKVPSPRTVTYGSRSFRVCGPQLWNELPPHVKNAQSLVAYKKLLKTHLFKLAYNL